MEECYNLSYLHSFEIIRGWQLVYEVEFVPCVDTVYNGISLKMFLVIYNEVY
jgi:hypothetical protein